MQDSLRRRVLELRDRLASLPEAEEPPPTTLGVLGRSHLEQDWQRLLVHFLTPDGAHGLDRALLEQLLVALSGRDDLDYAFSRFDLDDVRIEQEVATAGGRPDIVIWSDEDWFVCLELKVGSSEGDDQTTRYVDIGSFGGIGLEKENVPSDGHHYVYLAPGDASGPEAEAFVHVSWEWLVSELRAFLADGRGAYPARTTAQLEEFIDTVRDELTMTEYEENRQERAELYVEHYDEISAVANAFDERWEAFAADWGTRLAAHLDAAEVVADPDGAAEYEYVSIDPGTGADGARRWVFRQGTSDWAWLFPDDWWRRLDEGRTIYSISKPNGRVGFLHRLEWHREDAVGDHDLVFYLRNAPSGHQEFYDGFANRFNADEGIPELLPHGTDRPGVKSNVLESTYDINVELHDDFFGAYADALARAFDDHVVSNPELVAAIDRIYEHTVEDDVPF